MRQTVTQELIDAVRRCAEAKMSYNQAAAELGMKRGAVAGIAHRNGIKFGAHAAVRKPKPSKAVRLKTRRIELARLEVVERPTADACTLFELTSTNCHWPTGDASPFMFCGAAADTQPYCDYHHRIAHR